MRRIQTMLLSLLVLVLLPLSVFAADEVDTTSTDETTTDAAAAEKTDDMIMLRQTQPIAGLQALTVAGQDIEATFLEETLGEQHGVVVLFHDQGEELESLGVITPLRHELLQYGWSTLTLSLNYPFEPNIMLAIPEAKSTDPNVETDTSNAKASTETDAKTADTEKTDATDKNQATPLPPISNQQRIAAALAFIQAKDIKRIIFLGHGTGGLVAVNQLANTAIPISALILVGTPAIENEDEFKKLELPILDLYGDQDLAGVDEAVMHRKVVMKRAANIRYTAREINGANHVFYGLEPLLTSTVRGWLYAAFIKVEESE